LLDYKDAPTDKGLEVFNKLWNQKIVITWGYNFLFFMYNNNVWKIKWRL
jgi:hypothetical protein